MAVFFANMIYKKITARTQHAAEAVLCANAESKRIHVARVMEVRFALITSELAHANIRDVEAEVLCARAEIIEMRVFNAIQRLLASHV